MVFQKFTHKGRGFKTRASIRSNGQIGFSHGVIRRFELDRFSHAVLYFDPDDGMIGVKPTNDSNEEGAIRLTVKQNTAWVAATAFLDYHNLPYAKTKRYELDSRDLDGESLMVFKIGEGLGEESDEDSAEEDTTNVVDET